MSLITLCTRRPVATGMVTLAVALFGFVSLSRLPVTLLPDLSYPTLTVRTELAGAAPAEVETLLLRPMEEALGVARGVRRVRSVARTGQGDVLLEFEWGTRMDLAVLDVRERLDQVELPKEATRPQVLRFDPSEDPIMRHGLRLKAGVEADEAALRRLRRIAEDLVQKPMEGTDGVAAVKISGGLVDEIQVLVDLGALVARGVGSETVVQRLREENANISGGRVEQGSYAYLVRTLNRFTDLDQIRDTVLERPGEAAPVPLRVRDVATVRRGTAEREAVIRIGGTEAVEIAVYKEGDANTVAVAERARRRLDELARRLPPDVELVELADQSAFIRAAIDGVRSAAMGGALLAVLVLYLFLRSAWTTAVVSVAIPVSVIAVFMLMHAAGVTLNIMSLGGIALAIGMLVDNAIVVLENIAARRERGDPPLAAAERGASEVAAAVTASTLTTVAVFAPLVFVEGVAGELFADQALVVSGALLISLLLALSLIPMLAARERPSDAPPPPRARLRQAASGVRDALRALLTAPWRLLRGIAAWLQRLVIGPRRLAAIGEGLLRLLRVFTHDLPYLLLRAVVLLWRMAAFLPSLLLPPLAARWQAVFGWIERHYRRLLDWALAHRGAVLGVTALLAVGALGLLTRIGIELIPPMNQGEFRAEITLTPGTSLAATDAMLARIARELADDARVASVYTVAGTGNRLDASAAAGGDNYGEIHVRLAPQAFEAEGQVQARLREALARHPGASWRFARPTLLALGKPLEIEISGYDLDRIAAAAERLAAAMRSDPRFADVDSSLVPGQPELRIRFDQARLAALGLEPAALARRVARINHGEVATRYRDGDREIDVRVRARDADRDDVAAIRALPINPESARPLRLDSVATVELGTGPAEIRRSGQQRVVVVSADVAEGDLGSAVARAETLIHDLALPPGTSAWVAGQRDEMERSIASLQLALALALAVFLVYLVMASQFESLLQPLIILCTVPLAAIGAIVGLYLTGSVINVVTMIGAIVLAGIVVNNAIVLLDLINRNREAGMGTADAILDAGPRRLRPILMTTLTTVLGLLPLAIAGAEGAEVRAPMAIAVIGGLLGSTLLTLVVIPVVYALLDPRRPASSA